MNAPIQEAVETLIKSAAEANDSGDAMRYAQAALNAANAGALLANQDRIPK